MGLSEWEENQGPPAGCLLFNCGPFNLLKDALGLRLAPPTVWTELSEFQEAISADSPSFSLKSHPSSPSDTVEERAVVSRPRAAVRQAPRARSPRATPSWHPVHLWVLPAPEAEPAGGSQPPHPHLLCTSVSTSPSTQWVPGPLWQAPC